MKPAPILQNVNKENNRGTLNNTNALHRSREGVTMKRVNQGGGDRHKAVMYLRVASQDHDDQQNAVRAQREACQREAERLDAVIIDEFADIGASVTERSPR
jgi:hypothetical protein